MEVVSVIIIAVISDLRYFGFKIVIIELLQHVDNLRIGKDRRENGEVSTEMPKAVVIDSKALLL